MWGCFYAGETDREPFALFGDEATAQEYAHAIVGRLRDVGIFVLPCFARCEAWVSDSPVDNDRLADLCTGA